MKIVKLTNAKFGTPSLYKVVSGYALYETGRGYLAYSSDRDKRGVLTPYIPLGGKKALEAILSAGGFTSLTDMEYVLPIK